MRKAFALPTVALAAAAQTPGAPWFLDQPLLPGIYTADPSAHAFGGRLYIYPSHDIDAGIPENDEGDHFAMRDYHVLSMDRVGGEVTDHGVALRIEVDNKPGVLAQVAAAVAESNSNIDAVEYRERDAAMSVMEFSIEVRHRKHLADVIRRIRRLGVVHGVQRV